MKAVLECRLPELKPLRTGKVRELFDLGDSVLMVATDRISAFDVIMANGVPRKGEVLTQLSAFWFDKLKHIVPSHLISVDDAVIAEKIGVRDPDLAGRSTLARTAEPIEMECVVRGYIAGSLFKDYRREGANVHGFGLPEGLHDGDRLPEPIFSPATKAKSGHDENISRAEAADLVGAELAKRLEEISIQLYLEASRHAESCGLILADTKFEFGLADGELLWIDEAFTPDSSRYWEASTWSPGGPQPSFDKQYVRDYLETINWDKTPPGPELPEGVVMNTQAKYLEAFRRITGADL